MKRIVYIVMIGIALLLAVGAGYLFFTVTPTGILSKEGLRYFEPTRLPEGVTIAKRNLFISNSSQTYRTVYAALSFREVDNVYSIQERSSNEVSDLSSTVTHLDNYSPVSVAPTCRQATTPNNQSYRLCHWIDYGRYSVYELQFVKETTYIRTAMATDLSRILSIDELNTLVDSFAPDTGTRLTVVRTSGP